MIKNKSMINPAYLAAAGMQSCSGVAIPMTPTYGKADRTTMSTEGVDVNEYQSLVGRLNWLTTKTRPDLRHAMFRLQRRMHAPTTVDAKALKVVYRHLRDTITYGITLVPDHTKGIEDYVDAAHAVTKIANLQRDTSSSTPAVPLPGRPTSKKP